VVGELTWRVRPRPIYRSRPPRPNSVRRLPDRHRRALRADDDGSSRNPETGRSSRWPGAEPRVRGAIAQRQRWP
jgi:hypothetical protein